MGQLPRLARLRRHTAARGTLVLRLRGLMVPCSLHPPPGPHETRPARSMFRHVGSALLPAGPRIDSCRPWPTHCSVVTRAPQRRGVWAAPRTTAVQLHQWVLWRCTCEDQRPHPFRTDRLGKGPDRTRGRGRQEILWTGLRALSYFETETKQSAATTSRHLWPWRPTPPPPPRRRCWRWRWRWSSHFLVSPGCPHCALGPGGWTPVSGARRRLWTAPPPAAAARHRCGCRSDGWGSRLHPLACRQAAHGLPIAAPPQSPLP
jgi:hypothetical protein